jgi:CBS domain-containing protein
MKAKELMIRDVKTCTTFDDANRAAQLMWDHDCGIVVVETPEHRVAGVVTDRDLCMAAYTRGLPLSMIRLVDVMSREVKYCAPDEDLARVALKMRLHQVRRLPVIDSQGELVGILSLNDIARRAAMERGSRVPCLREELVAETLAEICRPRESCAEIPSLIPPVPAEREPLERRPLLTL